ncbi:MAG: hypothetical protein HYX69_00175 [Planctomycetia bacterium]|nr:hypothetical protein [Planctomycetia bacterium]
MNQTHDESTPGLARTLDLLVDGELDEGRRRELLAGFEEQTGAWRRCALAFLEAQSFKREIRDLAQPPGRMVIEPSPARRSWWRLPYTGLPLAMAASFIVAFGLGWIVRHPVAEMPGVDEAGIAALPTDIAQGISQGGSAPDRWDTVTLVMDDGSGGQKRRFDLPIVETGSADAAWVDRDAAIVPPELADAFSRLGHRVHQQRKFVPVDLEDGRQLVVPVDEIEFTPVSTQAYQ